MLVRRIATVTICAPLASMARRVSSKSRYLPVPTRSRERYCRPAMTSASSTAIFSGAFTLAPSHRDDHLDPVAVRDPGLAEPAARHDLAVPLDREPPPGEGERVDQLVEGERGGKFARRPVQDDADGRGHAAIIGGSAPPAGLTSAGSGSRTRGSPEAPRRRPSAARRRVRRGRGGSTPPPPCSRRSPDGSA